MATVTVMKANQMQPENSVSHLTEVIVNLGHAANLIITAVCVINSVTVHGTVAKHSLSSQINKIPKMG